MQNSLTSVVLFTALFFTFLLVSKLGSVHLPLKYEVVYYGSLPSFCPPFATLAANMAFSSTVVTSFCKEGTFRCFFYVFCFVTMRQGYTHYSHVDCGEEIETLISISIGFPCVHVCLEMVDVAAKEVAPAQVAQVVVVGGVVRLEDCLPRGFLPHLDLVFRFWRLRRCPCRYLSQRKIFTHRSSSKE